MGLEHEQVIPDEGLPFKLFRFEGGNGNYIRDRHWHRPIEVFAVYDGEVTFHIGSRSVKLEEGQFIIVNSNEIHSIEALKPNYTLVLQIPIEIFHYYSKKEIVYFSGQSNSDDNEIPDLIWKMQKDYSVKNTGYEFSVQSLFYRILYLMVNFYREDKISEDIEKSYKKLNNLTKITDYIREHYQEKITLDSLSEEFGYAPAYISRMFIKYGKINFKTYLINLRLEMAYQDLVRTEDSINEIAVRNGFPNSKSFSKCFEEKYGQLPSVYRKNNS